MKALSSKEPVIPIKKKVKGESKIIVEKFDMPEIEEFKPLNNTRKVHYPMMIKKYKIEKDVDEQHFDDFRMAMNVIIKNDNDELFQNLLDKKSGVQANDSQGQDGTKVSDIETAMS